MKARVIVAMPAQGSVKAKTSLCLAEMCLKYGHRISEVWTLSNTYLHRSREKLMAAAVESDASHLMFIDSDVIFPPDGMERLLRQKKGIIGATYHLKWQGNKVLAHKPLGTKYGASREPRKFLKPNETHEVRALPTGFMLVDLDIVRPVPQPWFDYGRNTEEEWMGEDVFFCELLREHGHQVFLDPTIPVGHVGDWVY